MFSFVAQGPTAAFVASLPVDQRLASADIAGDLAHVATLQEAGLLNRRESKALAAALRTCYAEIQSGTFPWQESLEDVHTNVEARVLDLAGRTGEHLHAGRSRNEQVALDERIYLRLALADLLSGIIALEESLLRQAKAAGGIVVPAYTHLQRAQPVFLAHALLAHFWRFTRDADRLHDAFARVNVSPAGAAAVAGTSLRLDPSVPAALMGFDRAFSNSIDATSDRDALVEVTFDLALLAVHLSELGEDLVLWSTEEFGIAVLGADHLSGSSFLPIKRNPDVPELVRGQAGAVIGDLVALLTMLKGLPLGYNRDLQAGKASVFHAIDAVTSSLNVLAQVTSRVVFKPEAGTTKINPTQSGALLVEFLVQRLVPFREAYDLVKGHLLDIESAGDDATKLSQLRKISHLFDESALALLTPQGAVAAVVSHGGTGPVAVAAQIKEAEGTLGQQGYYRNVIAKKNSRIDAVLSGEAGP